MVNNNPTPLTDDEALALPKYAHITVRKYGAKQARKALVLSTQRVDRWTLVGYALIVAGDWDTISPVSHTAILGGLAPHTITLEA